MGRQAHRAGLVAALAALGVATAAPGSAADADVRALAFDCYTCHGPDGVSPGPMPTIAGKSARYLRRKLREFRAGKGDPTIMGRIAAGLSDADIDALAEYLAASERRP